MDGLKETDWDIIISGTGLPESLLALALSRSGQKVLHVDKNDYYGGSAAALSMQDAEQWVESVNGSSPYWSAFQSATIATSPTTSTDINPKSRSSVLGSPRRYSLTLSPAAIAARSALITSVVSARIDQQLEFVAHGSTWLLSSPQLAHSHLEPPRSSGSSDDNSTLAPSLSKVPNSREDILANHTVSPKGKRSINKFLRFVADLDGVDQQEIWQQKRNEPFDEFLRGSFGMGEELQKPIHALTASLNSSAATQTEWALRRIERHLRSMGALGPGFGAVLPKYGGLAEVVQAACRAQAVGGGVYMLGIGVRGVQKVDNNGKQAVEVQLSSGEKVRTRWLVGGVANIPRVTLEDVCGEQPTHHSTTIISSPLEALFTKVTEESPDPAGVTISVPGQDGAPPVQIIAHSSITEECPPGQCVLYAMTQEASAIDSSGLSSAVHALIESVDPEARVLWQLEYEHRGLIITGNSNLSNNIIVLPEASTDAVFNDGVLDTVKSAWKKVLGLENGEGEFLRFPPRQGEEPTEEDDVGL